MVKNRKNGRDNVKVVPELGANAKGEQQGGIPVEMTDPFTSQEVDVRGTKRMRPDKKPVKATWYQIMWLSAIRLAVSAGSKIYANKQKTKMAMSEAQLMHATKMAQGQEAYQGKLLEARQSDWKDEAVLLILSAPIAVLAWAVVSDDPTAMDKVKLFFEYFSTLPSWFTNLWILVVARIYGIKGTQIFRNGGKK